MPAKPNVFNIPASAPFLPVLIDALRAGKLVPGFPASDEPLELARATLYLPTRRACRLARDVFLERLDGDAAILPRIVPLGDLDEDEIAFADAAIGAESLTLPEAMSGLERTMPLAALILKWSQTIAPTQRGQVPLIANNPVTAFQLAQDLARLMDDMTTRQVDWGRLDRLVPTEFDTYWGYTLDFLKFIRAQWPQILADKQRVEPADRRDRLIEAETARLARTSDPVIAAGSTGSMPSTATLLDKIAKLPHGAVVLPGLDTSLDDASWDKIAHEAETAHGHPQFAMVSLIKRIGILRSEIDVLGTPAAHGRERIVSEALRPALASEYWHDLTRDTSFAAKADTAMATISVIETSSAEEEALSIAIALRETIEDPSKTAALVTPDVSLGRRVAALLARWNVIADDSRGLSLADVPEGIFARLIAEGAQEDFAPIPLLALLKHQNSPFDMSAVGALERAILRGPRPSRGIEGLSQALIDIRVELISHKARQGSDLHSSDQRLTLTDSELDAAAALIATLKHAMTPLETLPAGMLPIARLAACHAQSVTALDGMTRELATVFEQLMRAEDFAVNLSDYAELFHAAIAGQMVHRAQFKARVRIYGLLEARLQTVDRLVLGGLVENVWPPEARADPWLSRPMRRELQLDLPERRTGLSAHDFAQALGAPDVVLSRAAKLGGAPTVASRFVQRLAAVAGEKRWNAALERGAYYAALARRLDETEIATPAKRPAPAPPFAARPRQLSVTEIEDLLRDPYTIYARRVLGLRPFDEIDMPPGAADRGNVIHDSIAAFDKAYPRDLPADPTRALIDIGSEQFKPLAEYPEARAFWWPRFERIAEWFTRFDAKRRAGRNSFKVEISGSIPIKFGDDEFKLTVRADRIECLANGRFAIIDYKTGKPPTKQQVGAGLSPQLTLEAAILRNGGFKDFPAGGSVEELLYVRLSGGIEAGEEELITLDSMTPDDAADNALQELANVLAQFADPSKPYYSLLHPMWKNHYGTYDHLARVQEWSLTGGASDDGSGE